jgi:hypothetical protein
MKALKLTSRRFAASLLLCVLALASITASVCADCDRMGLASDHQGLFTVQITTQGLAATGMGVPAAVFNL